MDIPVDLNILPLRSYNIRIGMDRLESHKTIINCLHKSFDCIDEKGDYHTIKGIYQHVSIRQISYIQLKKCIRKGFQLYAIKIVDNESGELKTTMDQFPILKEFQDVFSDEIPGLPPKRDLEFTIDLNPGYTSISQAPYCMSCILELIELRMQL